MNENEPLAAELTRQDWKIIMAALGELPGKIMFETAKKVEALLKEPRE